MIVLALDTALDVASAGLWDSGSETELATESVRVARGHDAILITLVEKASAHLPNAFSRIDRIAVTVGPGSFTGLRIAVAAARAFGLVTGAPVVGVSTLAAFAADELREQRERGDLTVAAIDARRGRVFVQAFDNGGRSLTPAQITTPQDFLGSLTPGSIKLVGPGSALLALEAWRIGRAATIAGDLSAPPIQVVARLGALADPAVAFARPLYLETASTTPAPAHFIRNAP